MSATSNAQKKGARHSRGWDFPLDADQHRTVAKGFALETERPKTQDLATAHEKAGVVDTEAPRRAIVTARWGNGVRRTCDRDA
jgi:hypothetical protein